MPEYIDDDRQPTRAERMQADLDRAAAWGEQRRAGLIRDAGCDSVAAMLARETAAADLGLSDGQQVAAFWGILDRELAVERRAE